MTKRQTIKKTILHCDQMAQIFMDVDPEFSLSSMRCFCEIALNEGLSLIELSNAAGYTAPAVSIIVGRLSDKSRYNKDPYGLVEKKRSPVNKREYQLYLSDKGHLLIDKLVKAT